VKEREREREKERETELKTEWLDGKMERESKNMRV
jgi:hypothetical protein